jgi:hypothetical protein
VTPAVPSRAFSGVWLAATSGWLSLSAFCLRHALASQFDDNHADTTLLGNLNLSQSLLVALLPNRLPSPFGTDSSVSA